MRSPPNAAVRRFAVVWSASLAIKVAAIAVLALVVLKLLGGIP
jgi:hypothetical protein